MFDFLDVLLHDIHVFRFCPTIFERVNFDNTSNMNMNIPQCSSVMSRMAYIKVYVESKRKPPSLLASGADVTYFNTNGFP